MNKQQIINHIIEIEGGYVNDPSDSGGETNYGITKQVALDNGYDGDMKDLSKDFAYQIYEKQYWNKLRADDYPIELAAKLVDMAVNLGVNRAARFFAKNRLICLMMLV